MQFHGSNSSLRKEKVRKQHLCQNDFINLESVKSYIAKRSKTRTVNTKFTCQCNKTKQSIIKPLNIMQ